MASLHYLTVQDILWINLQVTKKVNHFNHARLEEATFYQYAYGESNSLVPQAGRFLSGFLKMRPFDAGNEATILIAVAAFLSLNGTSLKVSDPEAADWLGTVLTKQIKGTDAVTQASEPINHFHAVLQPDVRMAIRDELTRYSATIQSLASGNASSK